MISVTHTLDDLANDLTSIATRAKSDMAEVVRDTIREGNRIGKGYAKVSAGKHGKLYHLAWKPEMTGATRGEYGPLASMPQGGMSFENGSRNQPPHLDAARSYYAIVPRFHRKASRLGDKWFW